MEFEMTFPKTPQKRADDARAYLIDVMSEPMPVRSVIEAAFLSAVSTSEAAHPLGNAKLQNRVHAHVSVSRREPRTWERIEAAVWNALSEGHSVNAALDIADVFIRSRSSTSDLTDLELPEPTRLRRART